MFAGVTAGSPGGGVPGQQHGEEVTDYWQTPCHHAKGMYSCVTLPWGGGGLPGICAPPPPLHVLSLCHAHSICPVKLCPPNQKVFPIPLYNIQWYSQAGWGQLG